jgi:hypothetical protein
MGKGYRDGYFDFVFRLDGLVSISQCIHAALVCTGSVKLV